ncbi:MAG: efflux RND transporter permease subunit, partial [Gammaproteobacteria bacterium]|nr:efflux RND transporter permease subunit [Gammaproteobacteria bacterium]
MNLPRFALTHRSIILAFVAVFLVVGTFNFGTMSRREDPEIIIRDALIVTSWPGAPATRVEELITDPIEDVVVEIPEVETVKSKSMVGLSVVEVTAGDAVNETDQVWDDVRAKIESIRSELPLGSAPPFVNSDFGDVYEIVFALYQTPFDGAGDHTYSPRDLEVLAERIEEAVELIDTVARVEFWGNQPERIYVEIDSADWAKLGITTAQLRDVFQARNIVFPGGELDTADARYAINPTGEFTSIEQMNELVIGRVDGRLPVQLGDLPVSIERRYEEPPRALSRITTPEISHQPAIIIGVSMKSGRNVTQMSEAVDRVIGNLRASVIPPDVALERVNDLPRQVETRIVDFQFNLLQGALIVLGVALLTMGWRPALIMATAVPLSMIGAFAVVRYLGIELEQFSIAALIIALGMVVDNAIVVSDNAVRLIHHGTPKFEAVIKGAQDLAVPILTSTLTTIAAFLPMLTIAGNVGEYVASLPVVIAATLAVSYFVAMLVTPIMCVWLLKVDDGEEQESLRVTRWLERYDAAIRWCLARPGKICATAGGAFLGSLLLLPIIGSQFFPSGSRDQFFIEVWLPEGSSIGATADVAKVVEAILQEESPIPEQAIGQRLASAVTFIGTGGPRLMLTQEPEYPYPYYAFVVVNTTDASYTEPYAGAVRKRLANLIDARITVDEFMLGPPIKDPVAFRLSGPDRDVIGKQALEMIRLFKQTPGTVRPYSNWGAPANQIELAIDSYAANLAGVTNADIAFATSTMLSGAALTTYREGDHLVPVMLRTTREKRENLSDLADIFVSGQYGKVPLNSVATVIPSWEASVIARRDGIPTVTVGARVEPGLLANTVSGRVRPKLEAMLADLPNGYFIAIDGELEETAKAQLQVVRAVGISIVLMILVLTIQYNSVAKPAVIMAAVPLGMIGVLIGLLVTGWPMGFMAMLGILALGGIVINNAIILVDFIETNVGEGQDLRGAVAEAGRVRMRPIILTTLTTIGGLLPLSLFGGALWAPMTNGMIFGLIVSTGLTLFVIPSLYVFMVEKAGMSVPGVAS